MKEKAKKYLKEALIFGVLLLVLSNVLSLYRSTQLHLDDEICSNGSDLVYFWGSWCPVCKAESPNIDVLAKQYRVRSIAVRSGSQEEVHEYMRAHALDFDVVADPDAEIASRYGITVFPVTVVCSQGRAVFADVGYTSTPGLYLRLWLRPVLALFE